MPPLFRAPTLPINDTERVWIDQSWEWLASYLGDQALRREPAIPFRDFLPAEYAGTSDQLHQLVTVMCGYLDLDLQRLEIDIPTSDAAAAAVLPDSLSPDLRLHQGVPTCHQRLNGRTLVTIAEAQIEQPEELIASIGHDLCHEMLAGIQPPSLTLGEIERLTDLLSIYVGLGVSTANTALRWAALSEQAIAYALARHVITRGEPKPGWAHHLNTNTRAYLKCSLRHLRGSF